MTSRKIKKIRCDVPVYRLTSFGEDVMLPANTTFKLIIDYPLDKAATFPIKTGKDGMGSFQLLREIGKAYENVYAHEDKYGIWGHDIDDLAIEGININFDTNTITLGVGS